MILAIDTATQYAALALYNQDRLYGEEMWLTDRNHTIELMPRIVRMLTLAKSSIPELTGLAVAIGPGSFTGLRIGLAVAKGMALPNKLPLIGIPTLDVVAYPWRHSGVLVWAIIRAGRGRILAASYDWIDQQWQLQEAPHLTNFKALAPKMSQPALCTGEIDEAGAQTLQRGSPRTVTIVSPAARARRAGYLAEIAAARLAAGHQDDPDTLEPIYPSPL